MSLLPKMMSIKEFREEGYLQEVNRLFLHPLGLALQVDVGKNGKDDTISGIWDCRDDSEGIIFDIANSPDSSRKRKFRKNRARVEKQRNKLHALRMERLGFDIEPIPKGE
jgi:hypothetical protein